MSTGFFWFDVYWVEQKVVIDVPSYGTEPAVFFSAQLDLEQGVIPEIIAVRARDELEAWMFAYKTVEKAGLI